MTRERRVAVPRRRASALAVLLVVAGGAVACGGIPTGSGSVSGSAEGSATMSSATSASPTGSASVSGSTSASPSAPATALPEDAVIVYRYGDSSVPPEYHRSVELTVTADTATLVIDSYGDVLARRTEPVPAGVWSALATGYPAVRDLQPADSQEGCAGGTTRQVTVTSGDDVVTDIAVDVCGGVDEASAAVVDAWIAPARGLFPPTDKLAPAGD